MALILGTGGAMLFISLSEEPSPAFALSMNEEVLPVLPELDLERGDARPRVLEKDPDQERANSLPAQSGGVKVISPTIPPQSIGCWSSLEAAVEQLKCAKDSNSGV